MKELIIIMLILVIVLVVSRIGYEKGKEIGYQEFQSKVKEAQEVQDEVNKQLDKAHKIVEEAEEYKRRVMR